MPAPCWARSFWPVPWPRDPGGTLDAVQGGTLPTTYDHSRPLELIDHVRAEVRGWPWVADGEVRLREEGHVVTGEVFVVPKPGVSDVPMLTTLAMSNLEDLDWRLHGVAVVVVPRLKEPPAPVQPRTEA